MPASHRLGQREALPHQSFPHGCLLPAQIYCLAGSIDNIAKSQIIVNKTTVPDHFLLDSTDGISRFASVPTIRRETFRIYKLPDMYTHCKSDDSDRSFQSIRMRKIRCRETEIFDTSELFSRLSVSCYNNSIYESIRIFPPKAGRRTKFVIFTRLWRA